ncbi:MAG: hypothetical protein KDJ28_14525 [Candidatus Competibacteraceae bacterium]|nr:hypothetical protein [Candidatus Competibacteraceae bacterium]
MPSCEPRYPGCAHRTWSAAASEAQKTQWLQRRLAPWADRLQAIRAVTGDARWNYWCKACSSAVWTAVEFQPDRLA